MNQLASEALSPGNKDKPPNYNIGNLYRSNNQTVMASNNMVKQPASRGKIGQRYNSYLNQQMAVNNMTKEEVAIKLNKLRAGPA